jgi:Domain of unknown function (DUF1707)
MATSPQMRIGDAEREAAATSLREHYAQGRLSLDELNQRLDASFAATTQGQLSKVTADLPQQAPWGPMPAAPAARRRTGPPAVAVRTLVGLGTALAVLFVVLLAANRHGQHSIPPWAILVIGLVMIRVVLAATCGRRIRRIRNARRVERFATHSHHHHHHHRQWAGPQMGGVSWGGPQADGSESQRHGHTWPGSQSW